MQNEQPIRNTEPVVAALSADKLSPFLQLAQARGHRKLRIALPTVPRRRFCLANRAVRAALSAAEQAVWQASGGDFLRSIGPK
jgi:hypothetical protein